MQSTLVVTTINAPNEAIRLFANECQKKDASFIVVGDEKTPKDFSWKGVTYLDLEEQEALFPDFARDLPRNHYSRKNIGYLHALKMGAEAIVESDDDNYPNDQFWDPLESEKLVTEVSSENRWINIYDLFSTLSVWPRGYPLEELSKPPQHKSLKLQKNLCEFSIIQGLADENPDVDAVYRLTRELPVNFQKESAPLMVAPGNWCPFNSQNTIFKRTVAVLAYLPSYCSFRMTDIWRSFIAQRCLWELGEGVVFNPPTVYQKRNEHNLLKDFEDEIPGYLLNNKISNILENLKLPTSDPSENIITCYRKLVEEEIFPKKELNLVTSWIDSLRNIAL